MVRASGNTLRISLERMVDESYDIVFGSNLFLQIAKDLRRQSPDSKYAIITDSNVSKFHLAPLKNALESESLEVAAFPFEAGEKNKTITTCTKLIDSMSQLKYGRDSVIIALGGGVVGDVAGFVAATFDRGVPCVQVPTTVLAQADASIGGKTAVDTAYGKNLMGAFKQPAKVYVDVSTLMTLPEPDYLQGFAEAVKHGVILDASFFDYLWQNTPAILRRDTDALLYVAQQNCRIKGNIVEQDPHEKGLRRILNYGHTAGHAIESSSSFELPHGACVSIGMMVAGRIAIAMGYFSAADLNKQEQLLLRFGLPTTIPAGMSNESIIEATTLDKKAKGGAARYVLPSSIGTMNEFGGVYATPVEEAVVMSALRATR